MGKRTIYWWGTRAYLVIGVTLVVLTGYLTLAIVFPPPMIGGNSFEERLPGVIVVVAGFAGSLVGLARMAFVVRGPRDEAARWRYRDH